MTLTRDKVHRNYRSVCDSVINAANKAGRQPSDIRIVGVSKYVNAETTSYLAEAGCLDLGESRPQVIWDKYEQLSNTSAAPTTPSLRWHLIGHLQRNKVARTLPMLAMFHALDSERLLQELLKQSKQLDQTLPVLVEINVSGDTSKTGLSPTEGERLIESYLEANRDATYPIELAGLMGMSGLDNDDLATHRDFEQLRLLRDAWSQRYQLPLRELSMGMSGDFEIAIEHGATLVRIGSSLFKDD